MLLRASSPPISLAHPTPAAAGRGIARAVRVLVSLYERFGVVRMVCSMVEFTARRFAPSGVFFRSMNTSKQGKIALELHSDFTIRPLSRSFSHRRTNTEVTNLSCSGAKVTVLCRLVLHCVLLCHFRGCVKVRFDPAVAGPAESGGGSKLLM